LRILAEPFPQMLRKQFHERPVGQSFRWFVRSVSVDLNAFLLRQIQQEIETLVGARGDESRTCEVHNTGDLLRNLNGARFPLRGAKDLQ